MYKQSYDLGNFDGQEGKNIKTKLEGKSWMNFEVCACIIPGGDCNVTINTRKSVSREDFIGMIMHVMGGMLGDC